MKGRRREVEEDKIIFLNREEQGDRKNRRKDRNSHKEKRKRKHLEKENLENQKRENN